MAQRTREWTCDHASATESGDYLQVLFEETQDGDARYILIQSQLEFPQDYDVKIEADGGDWYAELRVDHATLDRQKLIIDGRDNDEQVRISVQHGADDETYAELKRVLLIMLPAIDSK